MAEVALALGSNLGDRAELLMTARKRLERVVFGMRMSSIVETEPVGYLHQGRFLNAVVTGTTQLSPGALLHELHGIEVELGRVRSFPNAPRTIDLDLLLFDDRVLKTTELILPHPRLHERFFVLVPLVELAPSRRHPVFNQSMYELLDRLGPVTGIVPYRGGKTADA